MGFSRLVEISSSCFHLKPCSSLSIMCIVIWPNMLAMSVSNDDQKSGSLIDILTKDVSPDGLVRAMM
jgi:hypothetical protein